MMDFLDEDPVVQDRLAVLTALQPAPHTYMARTQFLGLCLVWTACRDQKGYGEFFHNGAMRRAHVLAYEWAYGPVPDGKLLHHTCHNPPCVRPDHVVPLTRLEHAAAHRVTHCKHGHEFNEANTATYLRDGQLRRRCRVCQQEWNRAQSLSLRRG